MSEEHKIRVRHIIEKDTPEFELAQESLVFDGMRGDYGVFYADTPDMSDLYTRLYNANRAEITKFHNSRLKRRFRF